MRFFQTALFFLCFIPLMQGQTSAWQNLSLVPDSMLQRIKAEATFIEIVPLIEGGQTVSFEDSATVKAIISFMEPAVLEGDRSCYAMCKLYVHGPSSLLLSADIHFFHASRCGFFILRDANNQPKYWAAMDIGGIALCNQLLSISGYPKRD